LNSICVNGGKWWQLVENGGKWWKMVENGGKWWKMVENGGKWWKMVENGGKWWKMVENGGKGFKVEVRSTVAEGIDAVSPCGKHMTHHSHSKQIALIPKQFRNKENTFLLKPLYYISAMGKLFHLICFKSNFCIE
jgi:hypothetical protein